jgi:hypothetical protein
MGGWMAGKAGLRIAYSSQKYKKYQFKKFFLDEIDRLFLCQPVYLQTQPQLNSDAAVASLISQ